MNEQDSIRELGSTREKNPNGSIHCLTIIGQSPARRRENHKI